MVNVESVVNENLNCLLEWYIINIHQAGNRVGMSTSIGFSEGLLFYFMVVLIEIRSDKFYMITSRMSLEFPDLPSVCVGEKYAHLLLSGFILTEPN